MSGKLILISMVLILFSACSSDHKFSAVDLKKYLTDKKISVFAIDEMAGTSGVYEVANSANKDRVFYIDQYKNVCLGMMVNLESQKNLTLSKRKNEDVLVNVSSDGTLYSRLLVEARTAQAAIDKMDTVRLPKLQTPEEVDYAILKMESRIASLKEQKKQMQNQKR